MHDGKPSSFLERKSANADALSLTMFSTVWLKPMIEDGNKDPAPIALKVILLNVIP